MSNERERGPGRRRNERLPPAQPNADHSAYASALDQQPTVRSAAPSVSEADMPRSNGPAAPLGASLDEPLTAPTRTARTLTSSRALSRPTRRATEARRTQEPTPDASQQAQGLIPLKTGAERDRALAAVNAASDAPTTLIPGARKYRRPPAFVVPRRNGPRSAITQFAVSMVVTAILISALTLSTPLGQAAALSVDGPARAYTNVTPWLPTPTPKPKPALTFRPPAGANPGQQAVINDIIAVFGPYAQGALAVSRCESGYDPNAWNSYPILNSHASGVFQILYPSTWNTTSYASSSPFNADANIHAAYQIFRRDGYSWREWQCQP